jgi:hypothetical protein
VQGTDGAPVSLALSSTAQTGSQETSGDVRSGPVRCDVLEGDDPGGVAGACGGVEPEFDVAQHVEVPGERPGLPTERRRRVGLAGPGPVEPGAEGHVRALSGLSCAGAERAVAAQGQLAVSRTAYRPGVSGVPPVTLALAELVADRGAVEDACVTAFEPVVVPRQGLDVQGFPGPADAMIANQHDPDVRAVRQGVDGPEAARQVQRDVLPVAAEVDGHLDAVEQR